MDVAIFRVNRALPDLDARCGDFIRVGEGGVQVVRLFEEWAVGGTVALAVAEGHLSPAHEGGR